MDCIDFQLVDGEIVCTSSYDGKRINLSSANTRKFFRILSENNYKYKELIVCGKKTVRYYGISQKSIESVINNRRNVNNKKVTRVNKYAGVTVAISGMLSLILILNSLGLYGSKKDSRNGKTLTNTTISNYLDELKYSMNFETDLDKYTSLEKKVKEINSVFEFEYEDRSNSDKAILARELYTDVVTKNSNTYGLPSNLMLAIGIQERGTHSTEVSPGGGFGLFQIQVENGWNWLGKSVTAYNFELGQMETIVVCQREDGTIDVNMLADLEYNTKVACMIMASDLVYCDYDIIAALQTYNSGTGVMSLRKEYGEDWVNHRENLPGDSQYLEHVLSYILEDDSLLQYKDLNGKEYIVDINNVYTNSFNKTR